MIDFISVFSRAFGGSCGSVTGDNDPATRQSKRVKSPKKGALSSAGNKPSSPRPQVVRFDENRDDNINCKKSLLDMASTSDESGERDSVRGSSEIPDDTPLAIMERRNTIRNNISDSIDNSSDEVTEEASFVANNSRNLQGGPFDNVRKRGLEQVGKFLPSLMTQPQHNAQNNNSGRNSESHELPKLLMEFKGSQFTASCPLCSEYLRYSYISSPRRNLVDINEGRDSSNKKLHNLMPPYCNKCQAHLLFEQNETKQRMIENLERWLEINLNEQTKGKIIFISASPANAAKGETTSPRVMIEFTPKVSKRGSVSFSFHDANVDPLLTTSSLTEVLGQIESVESESERNGCLDHHSGRGLFSSDSDGTPATDDLIAQAHNPMQITNTESEERAILQNYSMTKALATDSIIKHLKMRYELTSDLCDRCQMPMMKMGNSVVYCIVCPVIDKEAKRSAQEKRKKMQQLYDQNLPTSHYAPAVSSDTQSSKESEAVPREQEAQISNRNAKLTALEEGLGFMYSPRNQDNDLTVSSCMTHDDHEPATCGNNTNDMSTVCNSQSIDQASISAEQQLLQQLSYYDHVNNQYAVGIEYTYSIHQQNISQQCSKCTTDNCLSASNSYDCSNASNSFASNIILQTTTVSDTQCPRNLPSNEMIWSPVNNTNNRSSQFSFGETSNDVFKEAENHHCMAAVSDDSYIVEAASSEKCHEFSATNDVDEPHYYSFSFPLPEDTMKSNMNEASTRGYSNERSVQDVDKTLTARGKEETIAERIARLSNSVRKFAEETRDDESATVPDESDLGSNRQQSFEGPLLTPHMFNLPEYNDNGGQETAHEHNAKACERESSKTVRVFGKTMLRSPQSQHEILPPLFPSPIASPRADRTEQYRGNEPALEKEVAMSQTPLFSTDEKAIALFPPPENSSYSTDTKKVCLAPRNDVSSVALTSMPTLEGSLSLHVGDVKSGLKREQGLNHSQSARAVEDSLPGLSRHTDYVKETSVKPNQSEKVARAVDAPSPEFESSSKVMDPPGKRITKRGECEPVDPPASAQSIESLETPRRNNRHAKSKTDTLETIRQNNHDKPKRKQSHSTLPIRTPKPTNYVKSTRQHRDSPFRNVISSKQKSKEHGSSSRKQSKAGDVSQPTSTGEKNVLLTIPSWVDDEIINSPLKSAKSFGDSSIDRLIQQINDIEADFGSIVSSIPCSSASACTLETMKSIGEMKHSTHTNNKTQDRQDKKEAGRVIASIEEKPESSVNKLDTFQSSGKRKSLPQTNNKSQAVSSDNSFDSDASEDSVLENLTHKIRHGLNQIGNIESIEDSDDDEFIAPADSQEEMLQLINRLNNAAESLRTFADFQD